MRRVEPLTRQTAPSWSWLWRWSTETKDHSFQPDADACAPVRANDDYGIETLGLDVLDRELDAWRDLAARALEPNAFFEPGFALPLARHASPRARPRLVTIWRGLVAADRRLVGLFPLVLPRAPLDFGFASLWLDRQTAVATPLLDPDCAKEALARLFESLAETKRVSGVVFPRLVKDGPVFRAIATAAPGVVMLETLERAALRKGSDRDELCVRGASKKALKDLRRRARRLQEEGELAFALDVAPREACAAAEAFLTLEASGWKRASGFLSHPSLAAFFRSATRSLAQEGKCKVATLTLDKRPIASGIVLESQGRAYFWKIAYDEAFRAVAPGVHLVYELTQALASREDLEITDSCAIANHPMIERFWPDRIAMCDVVAPLPGTSHAVFARACRMEMARRKLRLEAKTFVKRVLGRRES